MKGFSKIVLVFCLLDFSISAQAACTPGVGANPDANGNGLICVGGSYNAMVFGAPIGIGTASPSPYFALSVTGSALLSSGPLWAISDRRQKKDIQLYNIDALSIVNKLQPVTYFWKDPKDEPMKKRQIGFIAQDVQKVVPDIVDVPENENDMLSIQYNGFIPVLTKAVQELSGKVEETRQHEVVLEQSIVLYNKRIAALEAQNEALLKKAQP